MGESLELPVIRRTSCPFFISVEARPWRDDEVSMVLVLSREEQHNIQQFVAISLKQGDGERALRLDPIIASLTKRLSVARQKAFL